MPNLSEAATVRLIETILFGQPLNVPAPVPTIKQQPRRSPRVPSPAVNPFAASNAEFFHSIVLRKRDIKASCSPVTPVTPAPVTVKSGFVRRRAVPPALLVLHFLEAYVIWSVSPHATAALPC